MALRQGTTNSIPKKDSTQDIHILELPGEADTKPVYFFAASSFKDEVAIVKALNNRMQTGFVTMVGTKAQARAEWNKLVAQGYACFAQKIAKACV